MCLGTTNYPGCGHGPAFFCLPGSTHCVPCFPNRNEEIAKLEHCLGNLQKNVKAVEERLSLLKNDKQSTQKVGEEFDTPPYPKYFIIKSKSILHCKFQGKIKITLKSLHSFLCIYAHFSVHFLITHIIKNSPDVKPNHYKYPSNKDSWDSIIAKPNLACILDRILMYWASMGITCKCVILVIFLTDLTECAKKLMI